MPSCLRGRRSPLLAGVGARLLPGGPVNSLYVYDSKYKINAYGALLDAYVRLVGRADGERLAAADSGPNDEAYVRGGSRGDWEKGGVVVGGDRRGKAATIPCRWHS